MNIVRVDKDDPLGQIEMFALLHTWRIKRCNVVNCTAKPTTIIGGMEGLPRPIGLCEAHFQAANKPTGPVIYDFEWDTFDAFADIRNGATCPAI